MLDALIIGGGPGGATAARLLADTGWSVAVVEKAAFPRRKVCGEYLAPTNYPLFERLGILDDFLQNAGPEVRRIELVLNATSVKAKMPRHAESEARWGRALGRDSLDALLLNGAAAAGAQVRQPCSVRDVRKEDGYFVSEIVSKTKSEVSEVKSRIVVAAHGSWGLGSLPTLPDKQPGRDSDLFAFKAHYENANLPADVMNMLVFPGGYAGMVNTGDELLSFSYCIRRDYLETLRKQSPGARPGSVVEEHILKSCPRLSAILSGAKLKGEWLSTGPIRPGIRSPYKDGIFFIGNAAGEAHPTIADGISMAMQSAWLLSQTLGKRAARAPVDAELRRLGQDYERAWMRAFKMRIRAADLFARLALSKKTHALLLPLVRTFPRLLTLGARMGGIVDQVVA